MNIRRFWQNLLSPDEDDALESERMARSDAAPKPPDIRKSLRNMYARARTELQNQHARHSRTRARRRAAKAAMTPGQRRDLRIKRLKTAGLWTLSALGALALVLVIVLDVPSWTWLDDSRLTDLRLTTLMYDGADVEVAGLYVGENRLPVDVMTLPAHVREAFVAAEDARFYSHHGVDLWRIGGALLRNIKSGGYSQGASTISQQLIKLTHLSAEKTLSRKANEAVLALLLEARHSKDEILSLYMNTVYFGHGAHGIEAAARAYFSKSASELDIAESALMAAVIKSPSGFAPHLKPERALNRRNWVLSEMLRLNFITQSEHDAAVARPIRLNESGGELPDYGWYIDCALSEAERLLGLAPDELLSGGYRIFTAMDSALQTEAQLNMAAAAFPPDSADGTKCQGALCMLDNETGAIAAVVGGREYEVRRGLNRATDVRRQPGSAIKPLAVYAPAVDRFGYLPTSFLSDVPTDFGGWQPRNAGDKYRGIVTLRQTAASSINVPTVELLGRIGVNTGIDFLNSVGIPTDARDEVLPLALGAMTYGVSPLELCGAYAALASGGVYREPYSVRRIENARGEVVYVHEGAPRRVMSEQSAYIMTGLMESVVRQGTASKLNALGISLAAKTGTAALNERETGLRGNRDVWLAAYTPGLTLSVWMGFDRTDAAHYLPESASGSNQPTLLARDLLAGEAAGRYTGGAFARPSGLREVLIDGWALANLHTVLLAGEDTPAASLMREVFTPGSLPTRVSTLFDIPLPAYDAAAVWDASGKPRVTFTCPQSYVQYRVYRDAGEGRQLAGTLEGEEGQPLSLIDLDAPQSARLRYDIVPYAPAQDSEGAPATVLLERTLWDELGRWFGADWGSAPAPQPSAASALPTQAPMQALPSASAPPEESPTMPMQTGQPGAAEPNAFVPD